MEMEINLGAEKHKADFLLSKGEFFSGSLRFYFNGPFPTDPKPFMTEEPSGYGTDGNCGGFYFYEIKPPKKSVSITNGHNLYICAVESSDCDGFVLSPFSAANLAVVKLFNSISDWHKP